MSSRNTATCFVATAALLVLGTGAVAETQRGVTDTEILVGTITDLSGVTAVQGVNNANAVRLAFDEVNEKGGDQRPQDPLHRGGQPIPGAPRGAGDQQADQQ